jgi:hypothetical protein
MKRCLPKRVREIPIAISIAIVSLSGCIHITHPSNVKPGWSADIIGGVSEEHYAADPECNQCSGNKPASGNVNVIQMNLAWGKRLESGKALRAELMVPLSMNNGTALGAMGGTTLDVYYQFVRGPFNVGAGGMAGFVNSGFYLEAGKAFHPSDAFEVNTDIGASTEIALFQEPGIRPFFLVGLAGERWKAGIWVDYLKYRDYLKRCDENCAADDFLERSISGGFYVGSSF